MQKSRDPNAMDVDVIKKAIMETEKEKYCTEGRCFSCGQQGHISRLCPDRKSRAATATDTSEEATVKKTAVPGTTQNVSRNVHKKVEEGEEDEVAKVAKMAIKFDANQQNQLAVKMTELGVDFQ